MSAISAGSVGVSKAITSNPASRALVIAALTFVDITVITIPACFAEIAFSIAAICAASSPSSLPELIVRSSPSSAAFASAPLIMATKNGFD